LFFLRAGRVSRSAVATFPRHLDVGVGNVDLLKTPRVVAAVVGAQLLGLGIGFLLGRSFIYAWIGGAVATLPGILLGLAWHGRLSRKWIVPTLIGSSLAASALGFMLPRKLREERLLADIRSLRPGDVRQIDAQNRYGTGPIMTIAEPEAVADFARALSQAESYVPNHPGYSRSWYVVVPGPPRREFELHLEPRSPGVVFGSFVEKEGATTWHYGSFQCAALRPWVARHLGN
jgi:hypothetical protein